MPYLTEPDRISQAIANYAQAKILWIDTEIADYQSKKPRLSLVQVLDDPTDVKGDRVAILDVLDRTQLIDEFIDKIMANPAIEKVFSQCQLRLQIFRKKQS